MSQFNICSFSEPSIYRLIEQNFSDLKTLPEDHEFEYASYSEPKKRLAKVKKKISGVLLKTKILKRK